MLYLNSRRHAKTSCWKTVNAAGTCVGLQESQRIGVLCNKARNGPDVDPNRAPASRAQAPIDLFPEKEPLPFVKDHLEERASFPCRLQTVEARREAKSEEERDSRHQSGAGFIFGIRDTG